MGKVGMKLDKTQKSNNNQSLHQQLCILQKACSQPAFFFQIQAQSQWSQRGHLSKASLWEQTQT